MKLARVKMSARFQGTVMYARKPSFHSFFSSAHARPWYIRVGHLLRCFSRVNQGYSMSDRRKQSVLEMFFSLCLPQHISMLYFAVLWMIFQLSNWIFLTYHISMQYFSGWYSNWETKYSWPITFPCYVFLFSGWYSNWETKYFWAITFLCYISLFSEQ